MLQRDHLCQSLGALLAVSKPLRLSFRIFPGKAVTLMLDNVREHKFTVEERKFEVNKLQVVCEVQSKNKFATLCQLVS